MKKLGMFAKFFPDKKCPVCGTNEDGEVVLLPKVGNMAEAEMLHAGCVMNILRVYVADATGRVVILGEFDEFKEKP